MNEKRYEVGVGGGIENWKKRKEVSVLNDSIVCAVRELYCFVAIEMSRAMNYLVSSTKGLFVLFQ